MQSTSPPSVVNLFIGNWYRILRTAGARFRFDIAMVYKVIPESSREQPCRELLPSRHLPSCQQNLRAGSNNTNHFSQFLIIQYFVLCLRLYTFYGSTIRLSSYGIVRFFEKKYCASVFSS